MASQLERVLALEPALAPNPIGGGGLSITSASTRALGSASPRTPSTGLYLSLLRLSFVYHAVLLPFRFVVDGSLFALSRCIFNSLEAASSLPSSSSVISPPSGRLLKLLQQAVAYQIEFARYHPRTTPKITT